jgi:hypothetical protein
MVTSVFLCVIRDEMIVFKAFLGKAETSDSLRNLLGSGDLMSIDSWSEVAFIYEKYEIEDLKRNWSRILKSAGGLQDLDKVPSEGSWGILYEN